MRILKLTATNLSILLALAAVQIAASGASPALTTIDDNAPGWVWAGSANYADSRFVGGSAHAGGSGSSGDYTFQGDSVRVLVMSGSVIKLEGANHRLGKLRISIDGKVKDTFNTAATEEQYRAVAFSAAGLGPGNHVLTLESVSGWTVVDAIEVGVADTPVSPSADVSSIELPGQKSVLMDPLDDFSMVAQRSANWDADKTNVKFLGNDPSRAVRKVDDEEYIIYRHPRLTGFVLRIFARTTMPITSFVKIYRSADSGVPTIPVDYRYTSSAAASEGGWTVYEIAPKLAMPKETNSLAIVFEPVTGNPWDPNLGQVTLTSPAD